jgi:hypothetical protein
MLSLLKPLTDAIVLDMNGMILELRVQEDSLSVRLFQR